MSQAQLGQALGVSFQQIQKYEKGVNRVATTACSTKEFHQYANVYSFSETTMARSQSLASMSVDALLKLREDIGSVLSKKVGDLKRQLSALTGTDVGNGRKRGRKAGSLKGRKVAPKYKGPGGETWAGRGATPRWMAEAIKGGAKKEDFAINGAAEPTKSAGKKRAKKK